MTSIEVDVLWVALATYAAALFVAAAIPGPATLGVAITAVRGGFRQAVSVGLGVALGDVLLVAATLLGLVAIIETAEWLLLLIRCCGAVYLLCFGLRLWSSVPAPDDGSAPAFKQTRGATLSGLALAVSNPKAFLFHAGLMPLILSVQAVTWTVGLVVIGIVAAVNLLTMGGYALFAARLGKWVQTPARLRLLNRSCGAVIIATAVAVAAV